MSEEKEMSVSFRVDKETKAKLEALATKEERTLGGQVAYLFRQNIFPHLDDLLNPAPSVGPQ